MVDVILYISIAAICWIFVVMALNPKIGVGKKDFDKVIDRIFRFLEMCAMTGVVNVVLRSLLSPGRALLFTLPLAAAAFSYFVWPIVQRHGERFEAKINASPTLSEMAEAFVPMFALLMLGLTLWIASLLSETVSITAITQK